MVAKGTLRQHYATKTAKPAPRKTFLARAKAFLTAPSEAFAAERQTPTKDGLKYGVMGLALLAALYALLFGLLMAGRLGLGLLTVPIFFVLMFVGNFLGTLVSSLWVHLWAYAFGARAGLGNTVKAVFFGNTPSYILGWVPFVNFITGLWSLVLLGIGLKKLQKLSTGRVVGTIVIAVAIPLAAFVILLRVIMLAVGPGLLGRGQPTLPFWAPL